MFFYLFDVWKWPQPVILTSLEIPDYSDLNSEINIWNPNLNEDDLKH